MSLPQALARNFLGHAPDWYKLTIVAFLVVNPLVLLAGGADGPLIAGWLLLLEFIFTLAMALRCYPLQPGGLLAIEGVLLGLTTPASVYDETLMAMPVILLLVFMVAGIYFLRELDQLAARPSAGDLPDFRGAVGVSRCAHRDRRADHDRRRLLPGVPSLRVR